MPQPTLSPVVIRFDVYLLDLRAGELFKGGRKLKLQEQPFQILAMLLERPGEVVTREELRQKLWSEDTFVDFEHSLNTAVKKIRRALNDEAGKPRFIETLRRRGYRFVGPISEESAALSKPPLPREPSPARPSGAIGKVLALRDQSDAKLLCLPIDELTLKEKKKLESAGDDVGLSLLFADEKILMVPAGTQVKIIDICQANTYFEVRILEGEHSAKTAIVSHDKLADSGDHPRATTNKR